MRKKAPSRSIPATTAQSSTNPAIPDGRPPQTDRLRSPARRCFDARPPRVARLHRGRGRRTDLQTHLRESLPALAVELARRLLAGYEPTAEQIIALCEETLAQLYPERDNLELFLSSRDASLLETISADWKTRHPGLRVIADAALGPGDCQVRSRFGLTDARRQAKLEGLTRELLSA